MRYRVQYTSMAVPRRRTATERIRSDVGGFEELCNSMFPSLKELAVFIIAAKTKQ
jgi:hypothetical protein